MAELKGVVAFVLIFSALLSVLSLIFSIWVYTVDYSSKLAASSSNEGDIGFSIETSNSSCGDNLCNGAETCSTCSDDCGSCPAPAPTPGASTGGGGGAAVYQSLFQVNKDNFNIKVVSGEKITNEIIIQNNMNNPISIKVSVTGIENYVYFNTDEINIDSRGSESLKLTIDAPEPGVYAGKIILTYQGFSKEILVLLNVVSEGVLFDVTLTVPDLYRVLRKGQRLPALIELLEVGGETGVDVTMNYIIKDFENKEHYTESETFYVSGAKSYSKRFSTAGLEPGDYILGVELVYIGGFATATAHFRISDSLITPQTWVAIGALVIAFISCTLAILFFKRNRNKFKPNSKGKVNKK